MTCNWIRLDYINSRFFHFSWKDIVWWSKHNPGSHDFLRYLKHYCQQHFGELVLCIIIVTNKRSLFCKTFLIRVLLRTNIWAFRGEKLIKFFTWCCIQNFESWIWKSDGKVWCVPEVIAFILRWKLDSSEIKQQRQNLQWTLCFISIIMKSRRKNYFLCYNFLWY